MVVRKGFYEDGNFDSKIDGEYVKYEDYERLQNELDDKTAAMDAFLKETQAFVATCNKMGIKHWGK